MRTFFNVHYVLIYQTVTSLTYVFVPLDFRPQMRCTPSHGFFRNGRRSGLAGGDREAAWP
ncbi:hypothetical protein DP806_16170 [Salmonella enterica subsp. enterica serovar Saintpaul]|nr:hypothetical protein [Salmonella enterica subsp. enterica serovar Saintpaul]